MTKETPTRPTSKKPGDKKRQTGGYAKSGPRQKAQPPQAGRPVLTLSKPKPAIQHAPPSDVPERIAKRMARAGICSRREAEAWILEGRVKVDGKVIVSPALNVTDANVILVDGKPIAAKEATRLWLYHKPKGQMTTHKDPEGRPTVFDALPKELGRVISVGRLDYNSEGLLLLTNDGALARHLELPSTGWTRRYRIRVFGTPDAAALARLAKGMTVEGVNYGPIEAKVEQGEKSNAWLAVSLQEGKNRELRKVFDALGHSVSRLIRIAYGPFQLGKLASGEVKEITGKVLKGQLGNWKP